MINPEKFVEMMDPSKAFAALTQGNAFDAKAQSKMIDAYTGPFFKLAGLYQGQTRKAVELCLSHGEAAVKEGQKITKDWVSTMTQANAELVKDLQDNMKEAVKAFEMPKPAKTA